MLTTLLLLSGSVQSDPSGLLLSAVDEPGAVRLALGSPSTASRMPDLHARWSQPVDVRWGDVAELRLWSGDNGLPAGVTCAVTLTEGPVSAASRGWGVVLEASATGLKVGRATNTGAGWALTLGGGVYQGALVGGTGGAHAVPASLYSTAVAVAALDPAGVPLDPANLAPTSAASVAVGTRWDTLSAGCGWSAAGAGASGASVRLAASLAVADLTVEPDLARPGRRAPPASPPRVVAIIGQSNAGDVPTASGDDLTWRNQPIQSGATVVWNGTALVTYPRRPGPIPYLVQRMQAAGVPDPVVVVRSIGGQSIVPYMVDQRTPMAVRDLSLLGLEADAILFVQGEADAQDPVSAAAYQGRLELLLGRMAGWWGAPMVVAECGPTCVYGTGDEVVLRAGQAAAVAATPGAVLVDTDGLPVDATLHHYTSGPGGGYDLLAGRLLDAAP